MNQKAVLLATIEAALEVRSQAGPLPAQEVSRLGRQLGLRDESTCDLVRQLSAEGRLNLAWGGAVESIRHESSTPSIHLEANATYVGSGAQIQNAAVGAGAHVQIAPHAFQLSEETLTQILAQITVPLEKLAVEFNGMTETQQQSCRQLIEVTEALQKQLLSSERPDKNALAETLAEADKTLGVLEKAGKLGAAAAPYLPQVWNMLHQAIQSLSGYLR